MTSLLGESSRPHHIPGWGFSAGDQFDLTTLDFIPSEGPSEPEQALSPTQQSVCDYDLITNALDHEDDDDFPETDDHQAYYNFRPGFRSNEVAFCTWIDQDASGDYDPEEGDALQPSRKRRHRFNERRRLGDGATVPSWGYQAYKRVRRLALLAAKENGCSYIITLRFRSEQARAVVMGVTDHWPGDHHLTYNMFENDSAKSEDVEDATIGDRRAQRRASDDSQDRPNLTGHPEARGCWGCQDLGQRCSLLDGTEHWPCELCQADEHDCELVIPPARKAACEGCKRRKMACSYSDGSDNTLPCLECQETGHTCIAGPTRDALPTYVSYNRNWTKYPLYKPDPTSIDPRACTHCREAGKLCSIVIGGMMPCATCDEHDLPCITGKGKGRATVESIPVSRKKNPCARRNNNVHKHKRKSKGLAINERSAKKHKHGSGVTRVITTKLCHPIVFNFEDISELDQCHFCEKPSYPVLGLGAREVEVIDWKDSRPWTEVSGGHQGEGQEPTRLCVACTMSRLGQLACTFHRIVPIPEADVADDFADALNRLLSDELNDRDHWCSICPALALYKCAATQAFDEETSGCGLLLCEGCALDLVEDHDGDMHGFLGSMTEETTDERPFGLRADAELLRPDGPLARHMQQCLREPEEPEASGGAEHGNGVPDIDGGDL